MSELLTMQEIQDVLGSELLTALGCTEPIAIALCAAEARALLGEEPDTADLYCSGNIIKNTHSVIVPNSGGGKGIPLAAALGLCGGDAKLGLQVLETVDEAGREAARRMVETDRVRVHRADVEDKLYIRVEVRNAAHQALTEIRGTHTHFTRKVKDGREYLRQSECDAQQNPDRDNKLSELKGRLRFEEIWALADSLDFDQESGIRELLRKQVEHNTAIGEEGIRNSWGQEVGRTILEGEHATVEDELVAYAAAGSDARMGGCSMPVVINSGSGNQGMTLSLPLIHQARLLGSSEDELLRALLLANLLAIHEKHYIGNLSAYCGAVSAASAAAAGIARLRGYDREVARKAVINALAISSGIVCDGAKGSCAGKIAISLKNALLGLDMAKAGRAFPAGEGFLGASIEDCIQRVGRLAAAGMVRTDQEILDIMIGD